MQATGGVDPRATMAMLTGAFIVLGALLWLCWAQRQEARAALRANAALNELVVDALLRTDGRCGLRGSTEHLVRLALGMIPRNEVPFAIVVKGDMPYAGEDTMALDVVRSLLAEGVSHGAACVQIELTPHRLQVEFESGAGRRAMRGEQDIVATARRVGWALRREEAGRRERWIVEAMSFAPPP